jgi:hypothetical protein
LATFSPRSSSVLFWFFSARWYWVRSLAKPSSWVRRPATAPLVPCAPVAPLSRLSLATLLPRLQAHRLRYREWAVSAHLPGQPLLEHEGGGPAGHLQPRQAALAHLRTRPASVLPLQTFADTLQALRKGTVKRKIEITP